MSLQLLLMAVVLVMLVWMVRAYQRGDQRLASLLALVLVVLMTVSQLYRMSQPPVTALTWLSLGMGVVACVILGLRLYRGTGSS